MLAPDSLPVDMLDMDDAPPTMLGADSPPKRGRGRPPGSKNKTSAASSSASSPNDGQRGARRGSRAWVHAQCVALVGIGNLGLSFVSKADALIEPEMDALTNALTAEAMSNQRILKWMTTASKITPHVMMIEAVVMIAVPRLQRRGILPSPRLSQAEYDALTPEQQAAYDEYLRQTTGNVPTEAARSPATDSPGPTVPVETRAASVFDGGYR